MFEDIEYESAAGVATVRFARPESRNALRVTTLTELVDALDRAESDDNVRAVIVTGVGSAFCAGADLSLLPRWEDGEYEAFAADLERFQAVVERLRSMGTPSVAAVNGPAVGAGCDIALACDLRIVGPEASLSEGFVNVGLVSGDGGGWLLPRLVGESKAKEYLLTGAEMDASDAVDLGLAVEETDNPEERAREYSRRFRDIPVEAVRQTKGLATMRPESLDEHMERALAAQWRCVRDEDG